MGVDQPSIYGSSRTRSPMNVNSTTQVNDLNADQLDSQSASAFISKARIYTVTESTETGVGSGIAAQVVAHLRFLETRLLGGGGGSSGGYLS